MAYAARADRSARSPSRLPLPGLQEVRVGRREDLPELRTSASAARRLSAAVALAASTCGQRSPSFRSPRHSRRVGKRSQRRRREAAAFTLAVQHPAAAESPRSPDLGVAGPSPQAARRRDRQGGAPPPRGRHQLDRDRRRPGCQPPGGATALRPLTGYHRPVTTIVVRRQHLLQVRGRLMLVIGTHCRLKALAGASQPAPVGAKLIRRGGRCWRRSRRLLPAVPAPRGSTRPG